MTTYDLDLISAAEEILNCSTCPIYKSTCKNYCLTKWLDNYLAIHSLLKEDEFWPDLLSNLAEKQAKTRLDAIIFTLARWQAGKDINWTTDHSIFITKLKLDFLECTISYCGGCTYMNVETCHDIGPHECSSCPVQTCLNLHFGDDLSFYTDKALEGFVVDLHREANDFFNKAND